MLMLTHLFYTTGRKHSHIARSLLYPSRSYTSQPLSLSRFHTIIWCAGDKRNEVQNKQNKGFRVDHEKQKTGTSHSRTWHQMGIRQETTEKNLTRQAGTLHHSTTEKHWTSTKCSRLNKMLRPSKLLKRFFVDSRKLTSKDITQKVTFAQSYAKDKKMVACRLNYVPRINSQLSHPSDRSGTTSRSSIVALLFHYRLLRFSQYLRWIFTRKIRFSLAQNCFYAVLCFGWSVDCASVHRKTQEAAWCSLFRSSFHRFFFYFWRFFVYLFLFRSNWLTFQ